MCSRLLLLALALPAAADEWEVAQPNPDPRGAPVELKLALDPKTAHRATIKLRQIASDGEAEREFVAEVKTAVRITGPFPTSRWASARTRRSCASGAR